MYPNLKAELARNSMSMKVLSSMIEMPYSTFLDKMNGRTQFTLDEAKQIYIVLQPSISLDSLFFNKD